MSPYGITRPQLVNALLLSVWNDNSDNHNNDNNNDNNDDDDDSNSNNNSNNNDNDYNAQSYMQYKIIYSCWWC